MALVLSVSSFQLISLSPPLLCVPLLSLSFIPLSSLVCCRLYAFLSIVVSIALSARYRFSVSFSRFGFFLFWLFYFSLFFLLFSVDFFFTCFRAFRCVSTSSLHVSLISSGLLYIYLYAVCKLGYSHLSSATFAISSLSHVFSFTSFLSFCMSLFVSLSSLPLRHTHVGRLQRDSAHRFLSCGRCATFAFRPILRLLGRHSHLIPLIHIPTGSLVTPHNPPSLTLSLSFTCLSLPRIHFPRPPFHKLPSSRFFSFACRRYPLFFVVYSCHLSNGSAKPGRV